MHQTFRLFVAGYLFLGTALPWPASAQPASLPPSHVPPGPPASMVDVAYAEPANAVQRPLYERLRKRQVLENLREFLSPLRLPHRLVITMQSCNRANAFYSRARVTICYEYIELIHQRAPKATTPEGVTYEDAVIAGVVSVVLHEVSHAVFGLLQIPILGREEDAADQLAGFIMVQLGKNVVARGAAVSNIARSSARSARCCFRISIARRWNASVRSSGCVRRTAGRSESFQRGWNLRWILSAWFQEPGCIS